MSEIHTDEISAIASISKKCIISKCPKLDHSECIAEYRKRESARVLKFYHEKYKYNRYLCECGASVLESYRRQHEQREKHKNKVAQNAIALNGSNS